MDEKILRQLIEVEKKSYKDVSELLGIPKPTIAWNVKKFDIIPAKKNKILKKIDLLEFYISKKLSAKEVGKILGVSDQSVYFWLKKYGIDIRAVGENQFDKVTISKVRQVFESNGHMLLSETYEGYYKLLDYICKCGNKDKISYGVMRRGANCKKCQSRSISSRKRENDSKIKEYVESKNCKFLESFVRKEKTRIKYICHCGSHHEMYMCNFKAGYPCKECKRRRFQGENNHNYNHNLSEYDRLELGRYEEGYKAWRRSIYRKYDYTCDICRKLGDNDLNAHHLESYIENPDLRTDINNGVCLCENCHKEFHSLYGFGKNTRKQYEEFKLKKGFSDGCQHI